MRARAHRSSDGLASLAAALVLAVVSALVAAPAEAQQRLGRLFFSPEERLALEEARREYELRGEVAPEPDEPLETAPAEPAVLRLGVDGVVLRSDGLESTWVNGSPVIGGVTREGLRVEADRGSTGGDVSITLPSGLETVRLRPGQKVDVVSGTVIEVYEREQSEGAASVFEPGGAGEGDL